MMLSWSLHHGSCGMLCLLAVQVTWNLLSDMPKSQGLVGFLTVCVGEGIMSGYTRVILRVLSSST